MNEPFARSDVKIAVLGGGTGNFTLLSSLKMHTSQLAAIVNMADDGGSTGVLRDELGVLPPGDVRQCLVALSESPKVRDLFNYRFNEGTFAGHSFGNLFLTALEKMNGSFNEAVETASDVLRVKGVVIPATLDNVRLRMEWPNMCAILHGEQAIDAEVFKNDPRKAHLSLTPEATANQMAIKAIQQADIVVISPGDIYTSLGPLLIIDGIKKALIETNAVCIYVANLVTKHGQTDNFTVSDHAAEIERFVGEPFLDYVLYNSQKPNKELMKRYKKQKAFLTKIDEKVLNSASYQAISGNFLGKMARIDNRDSLPVVRSLIRHDADAVASAIVEIFNRK